MINIDRNGKANMQDYIYLVRHILLVLSSIALGYTISDLDPKIHKFFTTNEGQFISIFTFLVTGLVSFKGNKELYNQILIMFVLSILLTIGLQKIKEKIQNNNKE